MPDCLRPGDPVTPPAEGVEMATVPAQIGERRGAHGRLPETVARMAFEVYHHLWPNQSFERLHERGGFGVGEVVATLYAHNFPRKEWRDRFDEGIRGLVSR